MTEFPSIVSRAALLQAQLRTPAFGRAEARSAAASASGEDKQREFAEARANGLNCAVETEALELEAAIADRLGFEDRETNAFRGMADVERGMEQAYERKVVPELAQTWSEWTVNRFYTVLRYGSLVIAVSVMAWIIMESGRSAMLSSSFWLAAAYASAILLIPSMLTARSAVSTDIRWQRRLLKLYAIPALFFGLLWIVSAAILFAGLNSGFGGGGLGAGGAGLFDDPDPAATDLLGRIMSTLVGLFADHIFGPIVLLSHILSDVFSSAAIGIRQQIVHKTGRKAQASMPVTYVESRAQVDAQDRRRSPLQQERAILRAVLRQCQAIRAAAAADFIAMVALEKVRLEMDRSAAAAAATSSFLSEAEAGADRTTLRIVK